MELSDFLDLSVFGPKCFAKKINFEILKSTQKRKTDELRFKLYKPKG
jgi:hypothetical protein